MRKISKGSMILNLTDSYQICSWFSINTGFDIIKRVRIRLAFSVTDMSTVLVHNKGFDHKF